MKHHVSPRLKAAIAEMSSEKLAEMLRNHRNFVAAGMNVGAIAEAKAQAMQLELAKRPMLLAAA